MMSGLLIPPIPKSGVGAGASGEFIGEASWGDATGSASAASFVDGA